MLDRSKPATLSAGMGAFVAIATVSVLVVIGTVLCVIRQRRKARMTGANMAEVLHTPAVICLLTYIGNLSNDDGDGDANDNATKKTFNETKQQKKTA